ncbi:MAG: hypothetical protein WA182_12070 [Candidatus Sulfotelmatobacter sp.]
MKYVLGFLFVVSLLGTIEWLYLKAKKAVKWTTNPNGWDTFAMLEIGHKERKLGRELSSGETRAIIEKWFRRWPRKPSVPVREARGITIMDTETGEIKNVKPGGFL